MNRTSRIVVATVAILLLGVLGAGCLGGDTTDQHRVEGNVDTGEIKTFTITQDGRTYFCVVKEEHAGAGAGAGLWCERLNESAG